MPLFNKVDKRARMSLADVIKYQMVTYCFFNKIPIADGELELLALLAQKGKHELNSFCNLAHQEGIYSQAQAARNSLTKSERKGLVVKEGKHRKQVFINPRIQLQTKGDILLDYKFAHFDEATKVQGTPSGDR